MKVMRWLDEHFEECLMFAALWLVVLFSTLQIIMRYVFRNSLPWPEEINRYLFIWFAYLGLSYAVRHSCHTRIDIFETLIPKLKKPFSVICDLGMLFFCAYMIAPGCRVVQSLYVTGQTSSAMNLPMYFVYAGLLVGMILTLARMAQKYIMLAVHKHKDRKEVEP